MERMERDECRDRIFGCWLGKNLGGALGAPREGTREELDLPLTFAPVNEPNDDLDLQLVWLDMLRKKRGRIESGDFAEAWLHIQYPCDEYAVVRANLERGLRPPETGLFNNYFTECMGSPIRSEIWACICAGDPERAAVYARMDAELDHAGAGVYGEAFFAALEAAAFTERDFDRCLDRAMAFVPAESELYAALCETREAHRNGLTRPQLRENLLKRHERNGFTHCVLNIAFTVAGLLYGGCDFLKSMVYAVDFGYDTDCTGATAGAVAGILHGETALRRRFPDIRFDERVLLGKAITGVEAPATVGELTDQVLELRDVLAGLPPPVPAVAPASAVFPVLRREFRINGKPFAAKTDVFSLGEFAGAPAVKIACRVFNPRGGTVRIVPWTTAAELRFAGADGGTETWRYRPSAPSAHQLQELPRRVLEIPPEGIQIELELKPSPERSLEFALLVVREPSLQYETAAEIVSAD